jgi:Protein of unknown function with PCYCGC motif
MAIQAHHKLIAAAGAALLLASLAVCQAQSPVATPTLPILSPEHFKGKVAEAYAIAAKHSELLSHIHCHCGCESEEGHKDLRDCFTTEHASGCEICMDEARLAAEMQDSGLSTKEISAAIDARFGSHDAAMRTPQKK